MVLERQGRVDEAVALLRTHLYRDGSLLGNHVVHLADLLARHGREAALRDLASDPRHERAAFRLATWLEGGPGSRGGRGAAAFRG